MNSPQAGGIDRFPTTRAKRGATKTRYSLTIELLKEEGPVTLSFGRQGYASNQARTNVASSAPKSSFHEMSPPTEV